MTAEKRRVLRMLCNMGLLICLPLTGFVWALPESSTMLLGAGLLTALSLAVGFGAEYIAASTENDIEELSGRMAEEGQRRAAELDSRDESIRQFDRIISLLTEQNHTLRGKLVAVQADLQRRRDALIEAAARATSVDDAQPVRAGYATRAV